MSYYRKGLVDYRNVKKVDLDGRRFDSKFESMLYIYLKDMEAKGEIQFLQCQPYVYLTRARIGMIPDFKAFDVKLQEEVFFEAKGFESDVWLLKRKLWKVYGPGRLRVFKGSAKSFRMVEEIVPAG